MKSKKYVEDCGGIKMPLTQYKMIRHDIKEEKEKEDMRFVSTGHGLVFLPPKKERRGRGKKRNASK